MAKPLNYTIMVMGPAYGTQSAYCAFQFVTTLLAQTTNTIHSVFFYADGVYNGNCHTDPANDEFDLVNEWQKLAQTYQLNLAICIAAAQRRGVNAENLATHFQLVGLSELSESISISDRIIQI